MEVKTSNTTISTAETVPAFLTKETTAAAGVAVDVTKITTAAEAKVAEVEMTTAMIATMTAVAIKMMKCSTPIQLELDCRTQMRT